jgi:hypothetical protein
MLAFEECGAAFPRLIFTLLFGTVILPCVFEISPTEAAFLHELFFCELLASFSNVIWLLLTR